MVAFGRLRLVDVLVSSAVVACLSAILTPVFVIGHSAGQDASVSSRLKRVATATLAYSQSYDDVLPLGYSPDNAAQQWRAGSVYIPADWLLTDPVRTAEESVAWANSIQPWLQGYGPLAFLGGTKIFVAGIDYDAAVKPYASSTLQLNGLLHRWPVSAIARPERLALFWPGNGDEVKMGFARSNPVIFCLAPSLSNCAYGQTGISAGTYVGAVGRIPMAGRHYVTANGTLRTMATESHLYGGYTASVETPFANYASGWPSGIWTCTHSSGVSYPCFFMPDSEFDYFATGMKGGEANAPTVKELEK